MFGTFTPFASTWLIEATGDKASPGYWLMFAAVLGIIAALTVYRGGKAIATARGRGDLSLEASGLAETPPAPHSSGRYHFPCKQDNKTAWSTSPENSTCW